MAQRGARTRQPRIEPARALSSRTEASCIEPSRIAPSNTDLSRLEYTRRMHQVQAYIDAHLDEPLQLSRLAEVAHFSAFHFHRLFAAWMGETLGDYLRRRRLEVAAMRLITQPGEPVLNIALAVGFGSAEAFARAFKARFGCSATVWREREAQARTALHGPTANSKPGQVNSNPDQASPAGLPQDGHSNSAREPAMQVRIVERAPVTVAYMRYTGPYGPAVSEFWQRTFAPWMATHGLMGAERYGISLDDPGVTAPEKCRYDACVAVPADFRPSGGALLATIAGGTYASTRYRGNGSDIGACWAALLRDWLPTSGMQLDSRPFFEYYPLDAQYDPRTGIWEADLCVPVVKLSPGY